MCLQGEKAKKKLIHSALCMFTLRCLRWKWSPDVSLWNNNSSLRPRRNGGFINAFGISVTFPTDTLLYPYPTDAEARSRVLCIHHAHPTAPPPLFLPAPRSCLSALISILYLYLIGSHRCQCKQLGAMYAARATSLA